MINAQHTPGPWYVVGEDCEGRQIIASGNPEDNRATVIAQTFICDEEQANARLIAAAPDLLEALEQALTMLHDVYNKDTPSIARLRATINKAQGN